MGGVCRKRAPGIVALLVSSLAGCAFDPAGGAATPPRGVDPANPDGGGQIGGAADPDGAVASGCPATGDLLACFLFDGTTEDGSGYRNPIQLTGSPAYAPGVAGDALDAGEGADLTIQETAILDPSTALAIELWLRPDSFPIDGQRAGLIDNEGQWGFFVHPGGRVSCSMNGYVEVDALLAIGQWHHLACTYDGAAIRLFLDGAEVASTAAGASLSGGGQDGTAIAHNSPSGQYFDGLIDELRIWKRGALAF